MFLGLDLGTSGLKAVLIDADSRVVAQATAPLNVQRPRTGWAEQDPAAWVAALEGALDDLRAQADLGDVQGLGLAGQMHGATVLDASDTVLRPCILWNDTRAHAEATAMDANPEWREVTGNIVFAGFTAPKLAWMREAEPELFDRIATVLLPKDYLRFHLTGEKVAEMSDASGTGWLDTRERDWSGDLLRQTGLDRAAMPRLIEGDAVSGTLRDTIADRFGLPRGTPVAGGGGDNAASAIGAGVVSEGDAFLSLGTSGVLFAATGEYRPDPETAIHTFCHALPDLWHQMGVILAASDALEWLGRLTGRDAATLTKGLGELRPPSQVLFLPYLGGERTPHNDAAVRGAFLGLDHATDATEAARAVLEGVAFAFRDCRDALDATGTAVTQALALGGGARSDYWLLTLATALGIPLDRPAAGEVGAAFGAARLGLMAATGAGLEVCTPPPVERRFTPDKSLRDAFEDGHARYRQAYSALRDV